MASCCGLQSQAHRVVLPYSQPNRKVVLLLANRRTKRNTGMGSALEQLTCTPLHAHTAGPAPLPSSLPLPPLCASLSITQFRAPPPTSHPTPPHPMPPAAAEDELRASGVPFAIVRPVALTEEPAGMPLVFDQGDTLKGKVSREVGPTADWGASPGVLCRQPDHQLPEFVCCEAAFPLCIVRGM